VPTSNYVSIVTVYTLTNQKIYKEAKIKLRKVQKMSNQNQINQNLTPIDNENMTNENMTTNNMTQNDNDKNFVAIRDVKYFDYEPLTQSCDKGAVVYFVRTFFDNYSANSPLLEAAVKKLGIDNKDDISRIQPLVCGGCGNYSQLDKFYGRTTVNALMTLGGMTIRLDSKNNVLTNIYTDIGRLPLFSRIVPMKQKIAIYEVPSDVHAKYPFLYTGMDKVVIVRETDFDTRVIVMKKTEYDNLSDIYNLNSDMEHGYDDATPAIFLSAYFDRRKW